MKVKKINLVTGFDVESGKFLAKILFVGEIEVCCCSISVGAQNSFILQMEVDTEEKFDMDIREFDKTIERAKQKLLDFYRVLN